MVGLSRCEHERRSEVWTVVSGSGCEVVDRVEKSVSARTVIDYLSFMKIYFHYISAFRSFLPFFAEIGYIWIEEVDGNGNRII